MIDWLKASFPVPDDLMMAGGYRVLIDVDGAYRSATVLSYRPVGSHDASVSLRVVERGWIEFDGNPAKFLQGHNVIGSDDVCGLAAAALFAALRNALPELPHDILDYFVRWQAGDFKIARLDLTQSYELESLADVRAWLRAAGETARMTYRGRATVVGSTLYFGKVNSGKRGSRWSLKCYCKADELLAAGKSHRLPDSLPGRFQLSEWAQNKVRVEVLLRRGELERIDRDAALGRYWVKDKAMAVFENYWSRVQIAGEQVESFDDETLKPAARAAYNLWLAGQDCARIYPRNTFYRHRKAILEATVGEVDIASLRGKGVIKLQRVLTLRPADQTVVAQFAWPFSGAIAA